MRQRQKEKVEPYINLSRLIQDLLDIVLLSKNPMHQPIHLRTVGREIRILSELEAERIGKTAE